MGQTLKILNIKAGRLGQTDNPPERKALFLIKKQPSSVDITKGPGLNHPKSIQENMSKGFKRCARCKYGSCKETEARR